MIFSFDDTKQSIRDVPNFEVPSRVDICEGDSATINITMSDTGNLDTIYVKIDGSLNPKYYRYTVDYSVKYLPKIKLFIKLPLGADFSTYRTLNVRLSTSPCDDIQVSSRGIVVYNQKSISSKIITYPGPCNSFKAQIKSNNNGMFVSNSWSVYKDSFGSKPIYSGKGDVITLTELVQLDESLLAVVPQEVVGGETLQSAAHDLATHEVRAGQDVGGTSQLALVCQAGHIGGGGHRRLQV
jgi:hypothetical protein